MYPTIVPLHLQEELIQIGEDITKHTFRVGDITIAISDYVIANNMPYTKRDVWRAVGSHIGKAAGTVQSYEALSLFFPPSVRRHYEVLSASHFRKAMQIDTKGEYSWQVVLDYAMKKIKDYGRPATVDELTKVFIFNSEPFEFEHEAMGGSAGNPVSEFINRLTELNRTVELLPIPEYKRTELKDGLRKIEYVINSLMVEV